MPNPPTKSILAEQLLLAKAEKQIQNLIDKVNVQLNELLVKIKIFKLFRSTWNWNSDLRSFAGGRTAAQIQ